MGPGRRSLKIITVLAALTFTGAALAGCSTAETPSDEETEQTQSFASAEEYQLAFAECMRSKGVDFPDPGDGATQIDAGQEGLPEAVDACGEELGTPPGGAGTARPSDEQHEVFLEMAQCFRDNGIDVPDPAPGESLTVPMDAPQEIFDECATAGESDTTGGAP